MNTVNIRLLEKAHATEISQAFRAIGWPGKTAAQYERYFGDQEAGTRQVFVARSGGLFAGYVTVNWLSDYQPFRDARIPEITDLNVLPAYRRRRIATALMDAAETAAATRSATVGLGVGLYADYGPAHRMYLSRGYLPDGRGIAYRSESVPPGTAVTVDDDLTLMMTRHL